MSKAVLYDATLCIGCLECQRACARFNGLEYDDAVSAEQQTSERKFTFVRTLPDDKYLRTLFMHCEDPSCASVCPVAALTKSKEGPVVYDKTRCMGCRYCMVACPFDVPKYQWSALLGDLRFLRERLQQLHTARCDRGEKHLRRRDRFAGVDNRSAPGHRR